MDKPKVTPKDFFLWAGAMVALYGSVISFIGLLFEYINRTFPDPLEYYVDPYSGGIRFAMASLIVLVPVTILLMRFIRKDIAREPIKNELWVRRWALVLTVFVAGAAVVGDLITLINYFLGGDLTTRFVLKVIVLLLVAGAVLFHFLADLRGYWSANPERAKMLGFGAGIVVLLAIVSGFFILGSPAEVRLRRPPAQKEKLPESLDELKDPLSGSFISNDPQSGEAYIYEVTGTLSFKLCGTFNKEGVGDIYSALRPVAVEGKDIERDSWQHGAGEVCFDRKIDPERYPPFSKSR